MVRQPAEYRLVWGDLHIHSYFSSCYWGDETLPDGFDGSPADCYRYARDVAGMDFGAVTDHTWSGNGRMLVEDEWAEILDANRQYHEPGRFVSVPAYEWNAPKDRQWGHRNTIFNHDEPPILQSGAEVTELSQLWQQLAALPYDSLSIPHHLARDATPYDWSQHHAHWEPVVEITSLWGNYEYQGNPHECDPNWSPSATGSFLQDGLAQASRVGVIGGGDNHTGHAGGHYFHSDNPNAANSKRLARLSRLRMNALGTGLGGLYVKEFSREGIFEALRARRCIAASGRKIGLWTETNGLPMGAEGPAIDESPRTVAYSVSGNERIKSITLVRNGVDVKRFYADDYYHEGVLEDADPLERLQKISPSVSNGDGENWVYYYVRVVQEDGRTAWSSPVWFPVAS